MIGVQFTVDLRQLELIGVQACNGCDAWELIVDAWGGRGPLRPTSRSSGQQSDGCSQTVRSSGSNLSYGEREFLRKRNPKEDGEWMWWWIMRLSMPFLGRRREGRRYRRKEMVNGEWSYSMLPSQEEERKRQCPFQKGKGTREVALGSCAEGQS
jgi:hypothetical protein